MTPTRVILHCSATKNNEKCDISEIRKWHLERGFKDVGYHIVVQPDGEIQRGRALNEVGAHCEGENADSIGICLIGNDKFTVYQFDALKYQIDGIRMLYNISEWDIYCHYQFESAIKRGKTCPNIPINNILGWYVGRSYKALNNFLIKVME